MTVLSAIQYACSFIGVSVPDAVMASTVREHVELKAITNDVANTISKAHTWQLLKTLATLTGDGTTEDFSLPSDYDWMPDTSEIWSSDNDRPLCKVVDENVWLSHIEQGLDPVPGEWIIYGGQLHIRSAPGTGITCRYFYQSNLYVDPAAGSNTNIFATDTDNFRLDERLLKLGIIYRWKQAKGQPYAQEMDDYEVLKEKLIARDKGATILVQGTARGTRGIRYAYPGNVPGGT
jgi:hypothetical protein